MKNVKRVLSFLLAFILFLLQFSSKPAVNAAVNSAINYVVNDAVKAGILYELKEVAVYSSLTNRKENEILLLNEDTVYMKLDRIMEYTGYTCEYSPDDPVFHLMRSGKRVSLDRNNNQLRCGNKAIDMPEVVDYKGNIWIPLHPTLLYLNARCEAAGKHLVILAADTTANEFIRKYHEMIESQLCTIQWADNQDEWYYDLTVTLTTILDVIFNDKMGYLITGRYEKERCKSILLNIMAEIDAESFNAYVLKQYPEIVKNTKWYNELDKYSKVDIDATIVAAEIAGFTGDALELAEYVEKVYSMQEFHIDMAERVLLKGSRYFGKYFKDSDMYKAADEIISLYKSKRTPVKEVTDFLLEKLADYKFEEYVFEDLLNFKGGNALAMVGMKLFIAAMGYNAAYDDFLTIESMYLLQKELENAFAAAIEEAKNNSALRTDHVDFMYDCALLYIQLRRAADKLLGIHADKVEDIYHAFLAINRETLYFEDPGYLSENSITAYVIASLPTIEDENGWAGRYDEYITITYGGALSADTFTKEEFIPYVELFADGTYELRLNLLEGMATLSGTWQVEPGNDNIVRLHKTDLSLNPKPIVWIDHDILFIRISESDIVLLEPEKIKFDMVSSTSRMGDIYRKRGASPDSLEKTQSHWFLLYLDFIRSSTSIGDWLTVDEKLYGIGNAWLYDINADSIPELFLGDLYNLDCCVYTIRDNKVTALTEFYGIVDITVRENIKTG